MDQDVLAGRGFGGGYNKSAELAKYTGFKIDNPAGSGVVVQVDSFRIASVAGDAVLFRLSGIDNADYNDKDIRFNALIGGPASKADVYRGHSGNSIPLSESIAQSLDRGASYQLVVSPIIIPAGQVLIGACLVVNVALYADIRWREFGV